MAAAAKAKTKTGGKGKAAAKKAAPKAAAKGKKAATNGEKRGGRRAFEDSATMKVVGEHNRKEGSRYHRNYELMKKSKTYGAFIAAGGEQDAVRDALKEGYVKVG